MKKNPGRLSYGSAGQGSLTHLTMELFKQQIGAFMLHIPYRGIAPAFTDLLGGQTQAMFPGLAAALPHLRSGRVRALAVTGKVRSDQLKDVPTLEGVDVGLSTSIQWSPDRSVCATNCPIIDVTTVIRSRRSHMPEESRPPWPRVVSALVKCFSVVSRCR